MWTFVLSLSSLEHGETTLCDFVLVILTVWYTHQKCTSDEIMPTTHKGVTQGQILSSILFNVYVDGLSVSLNSFSIRRQIGLILLKLFILC